jgi:hypothetical protein
MTPVSMGSARSLWGLTFHSKSAEAGSKEKKTELGIKGWIKGKQ